MKRTTILAAVIALPLALTACEQGPPPCTTIGKPSQVEIDAAAGGAEIEREVGTTECVVVGDTWVDGATLEEEN